MYSLEEFSSAKLFVVTWMEQGSIPHRGISFVDRISNNLEPPSITADDGDFGNTKALTKLTALKGLTLHEVQN